MHEDAGLILPRGEDGQELEDAHERRGGLERDGAGRIGFAPRTSLRDAGKRGLGWLVGRALPHGRYDRCLFVLAHMRCGSTALSNIVCSRPDFSGYGESHVTHDGRDAPGRLAVNCARRKGWDARAPWQFDKILHSRLDAAAPPAFFSARAIFLVREPFASVRSIVDLFARLGRDEYRTHEEAASYYIGRLAALAEMWPRFEAARRIGLTHEALLRDPDAVLAAISTRLGITPPLVNAYRSKAASRRGGGGDPLVSGRHSRIEPGLPGRPVDPSDLDLSPATCVQLQESYAALAALFGRDAAQERRGRSELPQSEP
ncbi:sulfotransferase [Novosphingobium sp. MBES04]|uniref:sulfotransferase n=1 Tax=Novosphingobium sp. MBES04 TaxID=1206458 RepID=UPI00072353E2|nr:sulfotransferase [Novosphingobium sp. MBES04]GAM05783.1 hypothetical conserved protein [Novosphingobium sp. MBES04]